MRYSAEQLTADRVIERLKLSPLQPEGGYFKQIFKSEISIDFLYDGDSERVSRSLMTGIYYLITPNDFSLLHRVRGTEIFHFYIGDPVEMIQFSAHSELKEITMSSNIFSGHELQVAVPPMQWQALRLRSGGSFALMGTNVVPGFEYSDFEIGLRSDLISKFPKYAKQIHEYTKGD